jgi:hypothetical protein
MRFAAIACCICLGAVEAFIYCGEAARPTLNDIEEIFIDEPRRHWSARHRGILQSGL